MKNPMVELDFRAHALREYPRECCGLVIALNDGTERYVPCRNIARTAGEHFILSPEDWANAEEQGEIIGVCHSHPDTSAKPSEADLVMCENTQKEWHIISVGKDGIHDHMFTFRPTGYEAPLIDRTFHHGVLDCYTLIKDWYKRERNIDLPDFERRDDWWKDDNNDDLYMRNFAAAGFEPLRAGEPMEVGDVVLMQLKSKKVNHGAVYIGGGLILHHMVNRLSGRDVYDGWFQEMTRLIVRYKGTQQ